jgi:hypothetical protein
MELNELQVDDRIVARFGSDYREMDILANDQDRKQLTVNVIIPTGNLSDVKIMQVIEYSDYKLEKWGKLQKQQNNG